MQWCGMTEATLPGLQASLPAEKGISPHLAGLRCAGMRSSKLPEVGRQSDSHAFQGMAW